MTRKLTKASCYTCGAPFRAHRSDARTCGPRCKKALQRAIKRELGQATDWTARDVTGGMPWIPANRGADPADCRIKGDSADANAVLKAWPHGTAVLFRTKDGEPLKPGRVNWLSRAGEKLRSRPSSQPDVMVPVEDLLGVHVCEWCHVHRA
ncbi:hypothetical protein HNQ64_004889 [Prosthecobacter dejongeii]|uniref:Uncharacterized protein n=1 Tax=Prosthecobacter dejongeii TaxID=48465 RepID=A0A7W7YQQ4_9BACT|nr:hypothetical protein [Prosthecobacter dejongeii]